MADLMTALAAAGGLVLAGVVAHGAWSARKAGPKQSEPVRADPADRADPAEQREPVMDVAYAESAANATNATNPANAANAASAVGLAASELPEFQLPRRNTPRLDALIDAMATLKLDAPVSGAFVLAHLPSTRRAGGKPFAIEGLSTVNGEWEAPMPKAQYSELQAGVQMANRTGALNEIEYSEFVQKIQAFAESVNAMPDFPDMLDVVARARELDAFAGDHDAQLAVHLKARGAAWSVGYIQQHASRQGFVAGVLPGRMVLPSQEEGAPPVLSLSFDSQVALAAQDPNTSSPVSLRDVTVSFDVPQTAPSTDPNVALVATPAPFAAWQASAQALALSMEAALVDDNGNALSNEGFASIGGELNQLYQRLEAHDLAAGSAAARRLFS